MGILVLPCGIGKFERVIAAKPMWLRRLFVLVL
jgi:hypothetical protein